MPEAFWNLRAVYPFLDEASAEREMNGASGQAAGNVFRSGLPRDDDGGYPESPCSQGNR